MPSDSNDVSLAAAPARPGPSRAARYVGAATVCLGASILLIAAVIASWLLFFARSRSSTGSHFGLPDIGGALFAVVAWPGLAALAAIAALYLYAGSQPEARALRRCGYLSLALAATMIAVTLEVDIDADPRLVRVGVAIGVAILGVHGVAVLGVAASTTRFAVLRLLVGLSCVAGGVVAVVDDGLYVPRALFPRPSEPSRMRDVHDEVDALAVSPDGIHLATASGPMLRVFDAATDRELWQTRLDEESEVASVTLVISPDGERLLAAGAGGFVVFELRHGARLYTPTCELPQAHADGRRHLTGAFARDGATLVLSSTTGGDGIVCFFNLVERATFTTVARACSQLVAPLRGRGVWGLCDGTLTQFDPATGAVLRELDVPATIFGVSPEGARILAFTPNEPELLQIHDVATHTRVAGFTIGAPPDAVVGPLRAGETWLFLADGALFEVDLGTRRVTRRLCGRFDRAALTGSHLATQGHHCDDDGPALRVRDANRNE